MSCAREPGGDHQSENSVMVVIVSAVSLSLAPSTGPGARSVLSVLC